MRSAKKKLSSEEIISRLEAGDRTVFDECSRWEIFAIKIKLRNLPEQIKRELVFIIDDCFGTL